MFFDETFTIGKKRMRKFSELVQKKGLNVKFNIRARVDTVDREVVRELKKAGLRSIHMGVEAGTDRLLKIMNKQITDMNLVMGHMAGNVNQISRPMKMFPFP